MTTEIELIRRFSNGADEAHESLLKKQDTGLSLERRKKVRGRAAPTGKPKQFKPGISRAEAVKQLEREWREWDALSAAEARIADIPGATAELVEVGGDTREVKVYIPEEYRALYESRK